MDARCGSSRPGLHKDSVGRVTDGLVIVQHGDVEGKRAALGRTRVPESLELSYHPRAIYNNAVVAEGECVMSVGLGKRCSCARSHDIDSTSLAFIFAPHEPLQLNKNKSNALR